MQRQIPMKQQKTAILITCIADSKTLMDAGTSITAAAERLSNIKLYTAAGGSERQALDQAVAAGIRVLAVQPLYLLNGFAYNRLMDTLRSYRRHFDALAVGKPLLADDADRKAAALALMETMSASDDGETAICLMGHGTRSAANHVYKDLQAKFRESGHGNYYIGTLHAQPSLDTVRSALCAAGCYKKVVLAPLMAFTGKHARQDLAGGQPGSWKSVLEREGYQVVCMLEGLAQIPQVQRIYLDHLETALAGVMGKKQFF